MINPKIEAAFSEQIKHELESAYLYYQMAAYFHANNLPGMAQWMLVQKDEELAHAQKFFDHIAERGGFAKILGLAEPQHKWKSAHEAFAAAYKHEQFITAKIHGLLELAQKEKDYPAAEFLQWFVKEQVEEEASTSHIAQNLEKIGVSGAGLVMMDKELRKRKES